MYVDHEHPTLVGRPDGPLDGAFHVGKVIAADLNTDPGQILVAFDLDEFFLNARNVQHCRKARGAAMADAEGGDGEAAKQIRGRAEAGTP